jgi:hypothetical protein
VAETRAELELEKEAREEAEAHAALLVQEKELEGRRLKELEVIPLLLLPRPVQVIRTELEQLLEEEKQAKRDEELVRTIQARMLTEEWEKREVLERLQVMMLLMMVMVVVMVMVVMMMMVVMMVMVVMLTAGPRRNRMRC